MFVLDFTPPMEGLVGSFNTIRLGRVWFERVTKGDMVGLIDKKRSVMFGRAQVVKTAKGRLGEIAAAHAHRNHNQKGLPREGAPERLMENLVRRYGPHIVHDNKWATVIYLRRIE